MNILDFADSKRPTVKTEPALIEGASGESKNHCEVEDIVTRLAYWLSYCGVKNGDRVGIYISKSVDSILTLLGILRSGAAYVPVDPGAPGARNASIHKACGVRAVFIERKFIEKYSAALRELGEFTPRLFVLEQTGAGNGLLRLLDTEAPERSRLCNLPKVNSQDLAYVLFTSGSTGAPKGVMLSHGSAASFIEWCARTFKPTTHDVFMSHAPLHFDLSILDIFLSLYSGSRLVVLSERQSRDPKGICQAIERYNATVWYSVPSILNLMRLYGKIDQYRLSTLRLVLFAGEVFPVEQLKSFVAKVPGPRFFNLYGPTETNVCTYFEVSTETLDKYTTLPIGAACENMECRLLTDGGNVLSDGSEGELCVTGGNLMQGYWNNPDETTAKLIKLPGDNRNWYTTGDIAYRDTGGHFYYKGRKDRMIKRRGFRVELGEIEACLLRRAEIVECAVIVVIMGTNESVLCAAICPRSDEEFTFKALKEHCGCYLPQYMVPDIFHAMQALPRTSTGKVDFQQLNTFFLQNLT